MEERSIFMEPTTTIAVIAIIVEDTHVSERVNSMLHEYSDKIIGRMGLPYRDKKLSIISVVIDALPDDINSLSGNLGRLPGVKVKVLTT